LIPLNDKTGTTFDLPQSALSDTGEANVSVGRAASNNVVVQDPRVSSHHFSLCVRSRSASKASKGALAGLSIELVDESSNGTWINDKPVGKGNRAPLSTGDRIFVLPAAHVGADAVIGFVVVALPFQSEASKALHKQPSEQKENDGGRSGNQSEEMSGGREAEKQLVSIVQCRLCEDSLIHRCVTAVPCGHNFCCGCMLDACRPLRVPTCPTCKVQVRQLVRNHSVDSIVETFIRAHPEAARPAESLERLNKIECDQANRGVVSRLLNTVHAVQPPQRTAPSPQPQPQAQHLHRQGGQARPPPRDRRPSQGGSAACTIA